MRRLMLAALVLGLAGCAKGADRILPTAVPTLEYERLNCADLANARVLNLEVVNNLSLSQERASSNDTLGVMFLGLPVASMTGGDREAELSVAKGRDLAIQSAQSARKCQTS